MNRIRSKRSFSISHVKTDDIVENSFWMAVERSGLSTSKEYISYMKGWPIWFAFETLCNKLMPYAKEKEIRRKVEESYSIFKNNLETYCKMHKLKRNIRNFLMHPEKIRIHSATM